MNENQQNKFEQLMNKVKEPPHGGLATIKSNRFQDQSWYVKLWRYRWYLKVPFDAVRIYFVNKKICDRDFYFAYSLAMGEAHYKMKWLYTMEEAMELLKNKRKK
jgi:hypothetical protein